MRSMKLLLILILVVVSVSVSEAQDTAGLLDGGVLSQAAATFKAASLNWPDVLAPFMLNLLYHLALIGFLLLLIGMMAGVSMTSLMAALLRWSLGIGFAAFVILHGATIVDSWFLGVKKLGEVLSLPSLDPSAVASYGVWVSDSIMRAVSEQGLLSYFSNPLTYAYAFTGLLIIVVYAVQALVIFGFLVLGFFLTAATPFFWAWAGLQYTQFVTMAHIRMLSGTLSGLFACLVVQMLTAEIGALLENDLRTRLLVEGYTLVTSDFVAPLIISVVLLGLVVWLPLSVARAVGGLVPSWNGGVLSQGAAAIGAAGTAVTNAVSSPSSVTTKSGPSSSATGGGRGLPPAQAPAANAWK